MKEFLLLSEKGPDVKFVGKLLAQVSSNEFRPNPRPRWAELSVYQTQSGGYVSSIVGKSSVPGETDRPKVASTPTVEDVKKFFGDDWLVKYLYDELGWSDVVEIA